MHWLALLLCFTAALALPLPDEVESEETRKVLGSSVVTSVSVIMDLGNGTQAVFTNSSGSQAENPLVGGDVGSPVEMATPDQYQYYSFDGSGNLIKRFMTKDDVSSIIATNHKHTTDSKPDAPTFYHSMPTNIGDLAFETTQNGGEPEEVKQSQLRVHNVVASVQNLLKSQMSSQGNIRPPMPTHISPEASASWSMILPSFFGNQPTVEETFEEASVPSEIQATSNGTQPPVLTNSEDEPSSHIPTSESNLENVDSVESSSESTINIKNVTGSLDVENFNGYVEQSSESQMLGDGPVVSFSSEEALSSESEEEEEKEEEEEEEEEATSRTESEAVQSTESMTYADKNTELPEEQSSSEAIETVQSTETLSDNTSSEYDIISTSNASSTTVLTVTTFAPSQINSHISDNTIGETSSDDTPPAIVSNNDQHLSSQSSENHKSETVLGGEHAKQNGTLPLSESTITGSGSGETLDVPELDHSVDGVSMLADSPADSIHKDNSASSDIYKETVPSETSEHEDNSVEQGVSNSAETVEHSNDSIVTNSTQHEESSNLSDELSSADTVEDATKENSDKTSFSQGQTKKPEVDKYDDSAEQNAENIDSKKTSSSTEKSATMEEHIKSDLKVDVDNLRDDAPTDSLENIDNFELKDTTNLSEEIDNSQEQTGSELVTIKSEESTESIDRIKTTEEPLQSAEDEVSSTSNEHTSSTLPDDTQTPVKKTHSESEVSTSNDPIESMPSDNNKFDSLEGQAQADSSNADKLGEQSSSELVNIPVISEENHSNFNQVDMSSSSSKETIAAKAKNGSQHEVPLKVPDSPYLQDKVSSTITKNDESDVSISPAETTDTSSSTPEVTRESDSKEEHDSGKVEVALEVSNEEEEESGESSIPANTHKDTSLIDGDIHTTHNLDESVASIVSQITNENIMPSKITINNSKDDTSTERNESSDNASSQASGEITQNSTENQSTEIVVTSVSTSKSTQSSSANAESSTEDGSGLNSGCGLDSSCSVPDILDNSQESILETDKISAGSESVEITSTFDKHNKTEHIISNHNLGSGNKESNDDAIDSLSDLDADALMSSDAKLATKNPLSQPLSKVSEEVVGALTTMFTERINTDVDTATPSSTTIITDSGEIPISSEGDAVGEKINETINLLPPKIDKRCNKEGSGSDSDSDSCENNFVDSGDGSGSGLDSTEDPSIEGSGDETTNSYTSERLSTKPSHTGAINTTISISEGTSSSTKEDELYNIMDYASSIKDIGITRAPNYEISEEDESNESVKIPVDDSQNTDKQNVDSFSTLKYEQDSNEYVTEKTMPSNDQPVEGDVMDLLAYVNSDVDFGITNSYNLTDNKTTEEPSSTVPYENETSSEKLSIDPNMDLFKYISSDADIGITNAYNDSQMESTEEPASTGSVENETSSEDLSIDQNMDLFKYINSDADIGITNAYDDSEMETTEEPASTDTNDIESTTAFDEETMMNDQPIDTNDATKVAAVLPDQENFLKDMSNHSNIDKSHLIPDYRHGSLPQKAQKDDSINDFKHKPMFISPGGFPITLEKETYESKRRNNTQLPDDTNWTKVEVMSHLTNTTPAVQPTSTIQQAQEETHPNTTSESGSHSAAIHDVPHSRPQDIRPQFYSPSSVELHPAPQESLGLEASTVHLVEDVQQFAELCNELAFKLWVSMTENSITASRSLVMSPFAVTSLLAMIFLGAKGSTSGQMNDMLKLDDMMTFNPHQVFRNVTESVVMMGNPGVRTAAFVRELYSDKEKGPLLDFYKQRASQFYDGLVEEADFANIGDIVRRRTNLQIKKQTGGRVPEYLRGNSLSLQPPLAAFSANIFQTECRGASTQGRDGEMYFTILPQTRQRRLVPIPSAVFHTGFLAGYEPGLDATVVSLGTQDSAISTLFVLPGQQGQTAPGDGLSRLEARLLATAYTNRAWSRLLRSLLQRPGMEVQIPRFSHRSLLNVTHSLQLMGLNELFNPSGADLKGLSGVHTALHVSDLVQINTFTTCGEEVIGSRHHVEIYPSAPQRAGRDATTDEQDLDSVPLVSRPRQARLDLSLEPSGFEEAVPQAGVLSMPLELRPRQARLPDGEESLPRLKFDRPFLYFVRHNPTGFILHMGRFNPRLIH